MKRLFGQLVSNLFLVQAFTWLTLYGLWVLYTSSKWNDLRYGVFGGFVSFLFYITATYVNYYRLLPRVHQQKGWWSYSVQSTIFIVVLVAVRMVIEYLFILPLHGSFYDLSIPHLSLDIITTLLAFLFGALLRKTIDYIRLEKRQKDLVAKQMVTELNLLKAQVQPHFLFNTLNNIYYLALSKDDKAPEAIAKLSDTMRYFIDEACKDEVPLLTEIQLMRNYIELEQMRMPNSLTVQFDMDHIDQELLVPPMLLMPLVENVYKHGIDKTRLNNEVSISLRKEGDTLIFSTSNSIVKGVSKKGSKTGLQNLRERLQLLYGKDFTLNVSTQNNQFHASLKLPVL